MSKKPPIIKMHSIHEGKSKKAFLRGEVDFGAAKRRMRGKMLATQGILTYYANRRSTVLMYADAFGVLVLTASLTSASLPKTSFGQTEKSLLTQALFI